MSRLQNPMYFVALKMLFGDRVKFTTLVAGLTFSVLLITQQGSIFCGLMKRFTSDITNTNAPIWVANKDIQFIDDVKPLQDMDLNRVRSVDGVEWAEPLLKRLTQARMNSGDIENVELIGVDPETLIGCPQKVIAGNLADLNTPDAVIVDKRGLNKLGPLKIGDTFELNDHRARVVAIIAIPNGFQSMPYVYTTYDRALDFLPHERKLLSYILVKGINGLPEETLVRRITQATGLGAYTEKQFIWRTIGYFLKNTGIPINFGLTVLLGVIVGAAVSAQTFYTFTLENIRQFGTLKALGASNRTLVKMILLQSFLVGLIGYGLGVGIMALFGIIMTQGTTELAFYTPYPLLLIGFAAIVGMCVFAALFSILQIIRIEPAIVFRG